MAIYLRLSPVSIKDQENDLPERQIWKLSCLKNSTPFPSHGGGSSRGYTVWADLNQIWDTGPHHCMWQITTQCISLQLQQKRFLEVCISPHLRLKNLVHIICKELGSHLNLSINVDMLKEETFFFPKLF